MGPLTLNRAAKAATVSKSTILAALRDGRLSGSKDEKGRWAIDPAELFRVFGKTVPTEHPEPRPTPLQEPGPTALEVEVKMLREQLERDRELMGAQIEQLTGQLAEQTAAHKQALQLLEAPRPAPFPGLWARLWGKR